MLPMANEQNLRPCEHVFTQEEAKKGGIKSGEARRRRKTMREAFEMLCEKTYTDANGKEIDGITLLCMKQFQNAINGDTKSFVEIRDTLGEKPVERVESVEIPQEVYERVKMALED